MPSAERLTRQTVVDRAIALADAEGLDALTIRRLAQELGVTPMALYWHFKNKDLLLQGVADHLLTEVTPESDPASPWNVRLRAMVEAVLGVMRRHPCMTGILSVVVKQDVPSFTRATEAALSLLKEAGFTVEDGYFVASYLLNGVIGLVGNNPACPRMLNSAEAAEWRRQKRLMLEALPPDRFPCMVEFAKTYERELDQERYYAFGLDLLLRGVEAMAVARTRADK
ncbi:TetR family transcriptional regulator [Sphaerimonospora cavernae]|uniref:TetR family transcriptional regulator n=1 Tax=Sphaerimonospora cavernae TaxID=1740611 RepID=A0ABV6TYC5_9ACTN